MNDDRFKIFSGTANLPLAESICRHLDTTLGKMKLGRFSDGEIYLQILENVRGADVFVVQPCCHPVDFNLMQLLLMIDAFKRASAWRITAVIPYYPYARQDRKDKPRVAISAKLVADLLETAGSSRVLTLDLHAPQIQGYFNIPVDHLFASPVLVEYFQKKNLGPMTIVSPDAGGVERARYFAKRMDAPLAIVDKRRIDVNVSEVMNLIGDVKGRPALVIDDIDPHLHSVRAANRDRAAQLFRCTEPGRRSFRSDVVVVEGVVSVVAGRMAPLAYQRVRKENIGKAQSRPEIGMLSDEIIPPRCFWGILVNRSWDGDGRLSVSILAIVCPKHHTGTRNHAVPFRRLTPPLYRSRSL